MAVLAGFLILISIVGFGVAILLLARRALFRKGWEYRKLGWLAGGAFLVFLVGMILAGSSVKKGAEEGYDASQMVSTEATASQTGEAPLAPLNTTKPGEQSPPPDNVGTKENAPATDEQTTTTVAAVAETDTTEGVSSQAEEPSYIERRDKLLTTRGSQPSKTGDPISDLDAYGEWLLRPFVVAEDTVVTAFKKGDGYIVSAEVKPKPELSPPDAEGLFIQRMATDFLLGMFKAGYRVKRVHMLVVSNQPAAPYLNASLGANILEQMPTDITAGELPEMDFIHWLKTQSDSPVFEGPEEDKAWAEGVLAF